MLSLSKQDRWARLQSVYGLLHAVQTVVPDRMPPVDQFLNDDLVLSFFCALVKKTGMDQIASQLEGPLSERATAGIHAAGENDFEKVREAMHVLESEGESSLLSGFQFWPVSQSWDWLAEDFTSGHMPLLIAFSLQGLITEFLQDDAGMEDIEADWAAPTLAMSLHPYLRLFSAGWEDYRQIASYPLRALLAAYFDYTDSPFLGDASRGEGETEFISWEDASKLVEAYQQAEPVWDALPGDQELSDPWYVFRETVKAFRTAEGGFEDDRNQRPD